MLIEFYGQNFGCFRDEFRLSMLATDIDPKSNRGIIEAKVEGDKEPLRLLRAAAIYGPNASGKSTVIQAANALSYLIEETFGLKSDASIPHYEPFALGPERKKPVRLGIKAIIQGQVYDYEIQFDGKRFLTEKLSRLKASGKSDTLVDRQAQQVEGEWTSHAQFALFAKDFRPNALLLSLADRFAPALAGRIAVIIRRLLGRFQTSLGSRGEGECAIAQNAGENSDFSDWLLAQLRSADVGVVDLTTKKEKVLEFVGDGFIDETGGRIGASVETTVHLLSLLHRSQTRPIPLPYYRESEGTRSFVVLASLLYHLNHGSRRIVAFIDEIDQSLHPVLLRGMLRHFNCEVPMEDIRGQLIFTTHDTTLLDEQAKDAVLRRDQIYFTAKDNSGAAELYSLAEFKERNNLNIARRYLEGRYGAIPALGTFAD
jgi:uncharacterized protein